MKKLFLALIITLSYLTGMARTIVPITLSTPNLIDTSNKQKASNTQANGLDFQPSFPGGEKAFRRFIINKLEYPEVAKLIGTNGKVIVQFVVERDGSLTSITPLSCVGAGCESEAVKVISGSPLWQPGFVDHRPVRVMYSVPISFDIEKDKVTMNSLRTSDYGFIFEINGTTYSLDEAEKILGKSVKSNQIAIALPYYDEQKYPMQTKKEVFLLKMKS